MREAVQVGAGGLQVARELDVKNILDRGDALDAKQRVEKGLAAVGDEDQIQRPRELVRDFGRNG